MTRIVSIREDPRAASEDALEALQGGGIILFPTETVYGLGVDPANTDAVKHLYVFKGRPKEKPFQWLIADASQARAVSGGWDERAEKLAQAFWPGPLTLVVAVEGETVGWRVPDHEWLHGLLVKFGRPMIATSANRSGEPPAKSCAEAFQHFGSDLALAVDGGLIKKGVASTVVSLEPGEVKILREGAISEASIRGAI